MSVAEGGALHCNGEVFGVGSRGCCTVAAQKGDKGRSHLAALLSPLFMYLPYLQEAIWSATRNGFATVTATLKTGPNQPSASIPQNHCNTATVPTFVGAGACLQGAAI